MIRFWHLVVVTLVLVGAASFAIFGKAVAGEKAAPVSDAVAVAKAERAWGELRRELDGLRCLPFMPTNRPSYQILHSNWPAAVAAFGRQFEKRPRLDRSLKEVVGYFPEAEKRDLVRAAVRHYPVGDPDTPYLAVLATVGTAQDMKRLQAFVRRHPESNLPEFMLEGRNPYAHVALAELADVPGEWRESPGVRRFLAELHKARPASTDRWWLGVSLFAVLMGVAVLRTSRARDVPSYRR